MILAHAIDASGYMLEPIIVDDDATNTSTLIVTTCPDGFYKPQWNGIEWIDAQPLTAQQQLDAAKQMRLAYLAKCRDNAIFGTFTSSCTGTLYTYTADDRARLRYERCARKAATDTTYTGDSIYTHEAGFVTHTGPQLIQLCEDGAKHEKDQWTHYDTKVSDVQNATTVDAVNAVTW